jgi:hypothetical protein
MFATVERFAVQRRAPKATVRCNGLLASLAPYNVVMID